MKIKSSGHWPSKYKVDILLLLDTHFYWFIPNRDYICFVWKI